MNPRHAVLETYIFPLFTGFVGLLTTFMTTQVVVEGVLSILYCAILEVRVYVHRGLEIGVTEKLLSILDGHVDLAKHCCVGMSELMLRHG